MLTTIVVGNLGADAQEVTNKNGNKFLSMNVAHNEKYTDNNGEIQERTVWVGVVLNFYSPALIPYLTKGTKVAAYGRTRVRGYLGAGGVPCGGIDIVATNLELCGNNNTTQTNSPQSTCPF